MEPVHQYGKSNLSATVHPPANNTPPHTLALALAPVHALARDDTVAHSDDPAGRP